MTANEWKIIRKGGIIGTERSDGTQKESESMIQDLTQKQIQLLNCLMHQENAIGADELAKRLGISARTVMRYLSVLAEELETFGVCISQKRGQGYVLEGDRAALKPLLTQKEYRQKDGDKRIHEMILEIIDQDEITIEKLSEAMFLSPSTLNKMTPDVKEFLGRYNLTLSGKPHYGLSITGGETEIRTLLGDIGLDYCNARLVNTGIYNISEEELNRVDRLVFDRIQEYGLIVADMDLNNLIARIVIALSRSRKGRHVTGMSLTAPVTGHNYQMILSIMETLGQELDIEITEEECLYVMVYSGFIGYDLNVADAEGCREMRRFVDDFLDEISRLTGINYDRDEKVMNVLSLHLKALMQRARAGNYSPNPIIAQIKNRYPLEMNYAILMAQRFEERFGVSINEDEIGYLTVYLGVYEPQAGERVKAVILCNYGIGTSQMILEKIQSEIQNILICGVYPVRYLDLALDRKPDVILSAVPVENYGGEVPVIVSHDLLSEKAIAGIQEQLWQKIYIEKELMRYFDPDCFGHIDAADRFQAIEKLGGLLVEKKGIGREVVDAIGKRERISSTEVGNLVAVPHVLTQGTFSSCIAIGILNHPIQWGNERVQMVFLACFNQSRDQYARIFRTLYKVVHSDELVRRLIQAENFQEFQTIMCRREL